jgi:YD repeat-containing protein
VVRLPFSHDRLRPVSPAGAAEQGREALRRVGWSITGAMLLTAMAAAHAGTERFDYDALGRLVRHMDPSGTITEYAYDAVGNILEVRRSTDSGAAARERRVASGGATRPDVARDDHRQPAGRHAG